MSGGDTLHRCACVSCARGYSRAQIHSNIGASELIEMSDGMLNPSGAVEIHPDVVAHYTIDFPGLNDALLCRKGEMTKEAYDAYHTFHDLEPTDEEPQFYLCCECRDALCARRRPKHAISNYLWIGPRHELLDSLTLAEKRMIALVNTVGHIDVIRKGGGQLKLKGHIVHYDVGVNVASELPKVLGDDENFKVIFSGTTYDRDVLAAKRKYSVTRGRVMRSIELLSTTSSAYRECRVRRGRGWMSALRMPRTL